MLRNRLYHVNDTVTASAFADDIDDMGVYTATLPNTAANNNYRYDKEGRLTRDLQEEISLIEWRVDGKVLKITRPAGSTRKNIRFDYDAMGNR